jgi:aspartate/methionine/tyrosine aminotransferase
LDELKRIGAILDKYDVIGVEDAAYLGMDFRKDYSRPGREPFIPTIASYTGNYVLLLSSSKIFNYAGQRVGCAVISPSLGKREFKEFREYFAADRFLDAFVQGGIYPTTSGVAHSSQLAVAHLMNEASEGRFDFISPLRVYGERASVFKKIMTENGFNLVYAKDGEEPLADGFYFTVSYPGMSGSELLKELLYYGISVTTLNTFGSTRKEGVRICVSLADENSYEEFDRRIKSFARDHTVA